MGNAIKSGRHNKFYIGRIVINGISSVETYTNKDKFALRDGLRWIILKSIDRGKQGSLVILDESDIPVINQTFTG
jgi:hypothetical protein